MPKIETPEKFASKLSDRQHTSPYIASLVVLRDAAIRSESAELLWVCGEALDATVMSYSGWYEKVKSALAALKDAGAYNG